MCDFISHIEVTVNKRKKIYFLTGDQVFKTPRGEALRKHCGNDDDLTGHGAIRWFYELESTEGTNKECTDFSSPKNFPVVIVKALKRGEMRGLGTPKGLLTASAWAEYDKVTAPAEAEYNKVRASALAEYNKVRASALAEYDKVRAPAEAEYDKVTAPAEAEYNKVRASAEAEYNKVRASAEAEYNKVRASAWAEYNKVRASAEAEYNKVRAPAEAEYNKVRANCFWDLFADTKNHAEVWK